MKHILFELEGCPFPTLNDEEHIKFCLFHAAEVSQSKVLKVETQKFVPHGVPGFALLAESLAGIFNLANAFFNEILSINKSS